MTTFAPGNRTARNAVARLRDLERLHAIVEPHTRPDGTLNPADLPPGVRAEAETLLGRAGGLLDHARMEKVLREILSQPPAEIDGKPYPPAGVLAQAREMLAELGSVRERLLGGA